jgi:hypothetical protein
LVICLHHPLFPSKDTEIQISNHAVLSSRGILSFALATLLPLSAGAEIRTWTNTVGRTFQAEFIRLDGANVIFSLEGGRTFVSPLNSLCVADQVAARLASQAPQASAPTPAASTPSPAKAANFGYAWPGEIRVDGSSQSRVVSEDPKKGIYIYESPHYRFTCDVRLTSDVLRNFAMMFETTWKYVSSIPLGLDGGSPRQGRHDILLFGDLGTYFQAGGPPGSAACFNPSRGIVLVPAESLGLVKTPTGFSLDTTKTNDVLIHELTHQLTPHSYLMPRSNGWFTEGFAEYMATTPYSWGYFRPDPHGNAVLAYVTARGEKGKGGRGLGTKLRAPRLSQFMQMPYQHFSGANGNFNYGFGLLLTHYFCHMEGGGRSMRLTAYLKSLRAGEPIEKANAALLGGGTFEKLETEFADAWRKKGVEIAFE